VDQHESLAGEFEARRGHLRAVAYRMLGSTAEADDALQEAWLRASRADSGAVRNMGGWLTTIVSRTCLDMLRSRASRREQAFSADLPAAASPEDDALLADSVSTAMLIVLDRLTPPERLAFVLHDLFDVPFDEIAIIIGRSPAAARQLASRARRRVQQGDNELDTDRERKRIIVDAFLQAARGGDFEALMTLLDPDVVLRADAEAARMGAKELVHGARLVAETFRGGARVARLFFIDGWPGLAWMAGKSPKVVFEFVFEDDRITQIDLLADPETVDRIALEPMIKRGPRESSS
jgi:RNA polymerase sigma-70 factor (ECF subfamily)